jgi:hypothetical protein
VEYSTEMMMEDSCCGIKNFAPCVNTSAPDFCSIDTSDELTMSFHPMRKHLWEPACNEKGSQPGLLQPIFECEKLSRICEEIPCGGVDKVALTEETVETDCQVELYGIRLIFFVFLVLYNAFAVNLVSTLMLQGVRILGWRALCPEGIYFRTKLREDGSLSKGYDQQDRADRISIAIRRFELGGRIQIYAGCAIFLCWAALAFF